MDLKLDREERPDQAGKAEHGTPRTPDGHASFPAGRLRHECASPERAGTLYCVIMTCREVGREDTAARHGRVGLVLGGEETAWEKLAGSPLQPAEPRALMGTEARTAEC